MPLSTSIVRVASPVFYLALMLVLFVAAPKTLAREDSQSTVEDQLIERERQRWAAIKRGDSPGFASFLASDFHFVSGMGVFTKDSTVKMMANLSFPEHVLSDFKVLLVSPDTAIVTYRASGMASFAGREPYAFNERHGSAWALREGEWLCVYHHFSPVTKR